MSLVGSSIVLDSQFWLHVLPSIQWCRC